MTTDQTVTDRRVKRDARIGNAALIAVFSAPAVAIKIFHLFSPAGIPQMTAETALYLQSISPALFVAAVLTASLMILLAVVRIPLLTMAATMAGTMLVLAVPLAWSKAATALDIKDVRLHAALEAHVTLSDLARHVIDGGPDVTGSWKVVARELVYSATGYTEEKKLLLIAEAEAERLRQGLKD